MLQKKSVTLLTLGCSKNLVDSEKLLYQFGERGYLLHHDVSPPKGSIVIINTCGFIGDAKEESINTILQFAQYKKKGLISGLYVMGCLSQRYLSELRLEIPEVDDYYGKFDFEKILTRLGEAPQSATCINRHLTTPSHYAYLKISEGCNRTCSYCAIPIITGKHQSRPIQEILDEARLLSQQGVREIQLIAQDLSYFGKDTHKKRLLPELTERLADIPGLEWIRLHYTYPHDFPTDLLKVMRERPNVCSYLDMALQHISDPMLLKMRRKITKAETLDLLNQIRQEVPGIHLRTTLLVGHPDETEADFQELLEFVDKQRFERLGAFTYSEEEGTYAARHYKDNVEESIKQKRLDQLMERQQEISASINRSKIGHVFKVMVDRVEGECYIGRTEFDSPEVDPEVYIRTTKPLEPGQFYPIRVTESGPYDLSGIPDN